MFSRGILPYQGTAGAAGEHPPPARRSMVRDSSGSSSERTTVGPPVSPPGLVWWKRPVLPRPPLILCAFDETVVLEVSDESRAEPSLVVARALDTSGRGVAIVQALSRDWGVLSRASGGKSVWAEFDSTARPRALLAVAHRHSTGFSQGAPH